MHPVEADPWQRDEMRASSDPPIERLRARVFELPTDAPYESDGTLTWRSTTMVFVEAAAGGVIGNGYAYTHAGAAQVVEHTLRERVLGLGAMSPRAAWERMMAGVRNVGHQGIAASAIAATDIALWDLKARLLGLPLVDLLGRVRHSIDVYGSGGFTSADEKELHAQLGGWVESGIRRVKMKIGLGPAADRERVASVRRAIGSDIELMVDANGAYEPSGAAAVAAALADLGVTWFEEPVSSDDVVGLRACREMSPTSMAIAAGEYGWDVFHFRRLLEAEAVDVIQPDATRCLGITGYLAVAALADAHGRPFSTHTAPSLHAHLACAHPRAIHVEWFHDHARMESRLFAGGARLTGPTITPRLDRVGLGIELDPASTRRLAI